MLKLTVSAAIWRKGFQDGLETYICNSHAHIAEIIKILPLHPVGRTTFIINADEYYDMRDAIVIPTPTS